MMWIAAISSSILRKVSGVFKNSFVLIFLFFFCFYLFFAGGHFYTWDGWAMHLTTRSLVEEKTLAIPRKIEFEGALVWPHGKIGENGNFYGAYGILFSIVEIPFYILGKIFETSQFGPITFVSLLVNPVLSALTCLMIFVFAQELKYSKSISLVLTFLYGLGTIAFPWSQFFLNRPLSSLLLLIATYFLYKRQPLKAGIFAGLCLLTRLTNLIALLPLTLYSFSQFKKKIKPNILFFIPILGALIVQAFLNLICLGRVLAVSYDLQSARLGGGVQTFTFRGLYFWDAFLGLLFSPGRGLFVFCPILFLVPWAFSEFKKKHKKEAWFFGGLILVYLFTFSLYLNWHGGRPWGPKFLFEIIPFGILALGSLLEKDFKDFYLKFWIIFLGSLGFLINLMAALVNYHDSPYSYETLDYIFVPSKSILAGTWHFIVEKKWDMFLIQRGGLSFIIVELFILGFILFKLIAEVQRK